MGRLEFAELAEDDINEILNFIAQDKPIAGIQLVERIREKCRLLADHPGMGVPRPRFGHVTMRSFAVDPYIIFYMTKDDGIIVSRVLHGARNLDALWD